MGELSHRRGPEIRRPKSRAPPAGRSPYRQPRTLHVPPSLCARWKTCSRGSTGCGYSRPTCGGSSFPLRATGLVSLHSCLAWPQGPIPNPWHGVCLGARARTCAGVWAAPAGGSMRMYARLVLCFISLLSSIRPLPLYILQHFQYHIVCNL